jgi:glycosyltransferase involved in cell wall biosynthesis
VVGNSRYVLDIHTNAGYFERATHREVIYSAYESAAELVPPECRETDADILRLGYLGRLHPTKGVEVLIDALALCSHERIRLSVAGTGNAGYVETLRRRATGLPVDFVGYVDPGEFLGAIDLLVVPSVWDEPLPRAVYEAYGHGVGVLASRRGGTPEIVGDELSGLLFDPVPDLLAALLRRCANEPELVTRLGKGGYEAAAGFRPSLTAARYLAAYERTVA